MSADRDMLPAGGAWQHLPRPLTATNLALVSVIAGATLHQAERLSGPSVIAMVIACPANCIDRSVLTASGALRSWPCHGALSCTGVSSDLTLP
jgi:hypothetical protein